MCGPAMPCYTPTPECLCPAQVVPGRTYRTILVSGRNSAQHAAGRGTHLNCGGGPRHPAAAAAAAGLHLTIWLGCVLKAQLLTFSLVHAKMAHRKCRCLLGSAAVHPDLTPPPPLLRVPNLLYPCPLILHRKGQRGQIRPGKGGMQQGTLSCICPRRPALPSPGAAPCGLASSPNPVFRGVVRGTYFGHFTASDVHASRE